MSPRSSNLSTRFAFFICFFAESSKKDRTEAGILNQQARLSTSNWFHAPQDPSSIPFSSHQQHQRTSEPLISSNHVYHLHSRNYEGPSRSFRFPRPISPSSLSLSLISFSSFSSRWLAGSDPQARRPRRDQARDHSCSNTWRRRGPCEGELRRSELVSSSSPCPRLPFFPLFSFLPRFMTAPFVPILASTPTSEAVSTPSHFLSLSVRKRLGRSSPSMIPSRTPSSPSETRSLHTWEARMRSTSRCRLERSS